MSYSFSKILATDYIGNSLQKVNNNYSALSEWTTNISNSSKELYEPLNNFYLFYKKYWNESIDFALSINAPQRLTAFQTNVLENSAKWISPLIFYYPAITKYDQTNLVSIKENALSWFVQNYPVTTDTNTIFVENTVAFLYCPLYQEELKIDNSTTITESTDCKTNDTSTSVYCWVTYNDNIACYDDRNACNKFDRTKDVFPTSPSCVKNFTLTCDYENGKNEITRNGKATIKSYFFERNETDQMICMKLQVKNCQWKEIETI